MNCREFASEPAFVHLVVQTNVPKELVRDFDEAVSEGDSHKADYLLDTILEKMEEGCKKKHKKTLADLKKKRKKTGESLDEEDDPYYTKEFLEDYAPLTQQGVEKGLLRFWRIDAKTKKEVAKKLLKPLKKMVGANAGKAKSLLEDVLSILEEVDEDGARANLGRGKRIGREGNSYYIVMDEPNATTVVWDEHWEEPVLTSYVAWADNRANTFGESLDERRMTAKEKRKRKLWRKKRKRSGKRVDPKRSRIAKKAAKKHRAKRLRAARMRREDIDDKKLAAIAASTQVSPALLQAVEDAKADWELSAALQAIAEVVGLSEEELHEKVMVDEVAGYKMKKSDKRVVDKFVDGDTDVKPGKNLWVEEKGGDTFLMSSYHSTFSNALAQRSGNRISLGEPHGNVSQTYINYIKKAAKRVGARVIPESIDEGRKLACDFEIGNKEIEVYEYGFDDEVTYRIPLRDPYGKALVKKYGYGAFHAKLDADKLRKFEVDESIDEARIKQGQKFGDWVVTQYVPVESDGSGGSTGGEIKLVNQNTAKEVTIRNDLALRKPQWWVSVGGKRIQAASPLQVIEQAIAKVDKLPESELDEARRVKDGDYLFNRNGTLSAMEAGGIAGPSAVTSKGSWVTVHGTLFPIGTYKGKTVWRMEGTPGPAKGAKVNFDKQVKASDVYESTEGVRSIFEAVKVSDMQEALRLARGWASDMSGRNIEAMDPIREMERRVEKGSDAKVKAYIPTLLKALKRWRGYGAKETKAFLKAQLA
jgi:hypothetical protein